VKRRQDKRLKELDVHLNSQTLNEKKRERETESEKSLIDFRFTLLFLLMDIIVIGPSRAYIRMVTFKS
jgi:hypothetical protein